MPAYRTFRTFLLLAPPLGWLIYASGVIAGEALQGQPLSTIGGGVLVALVGMPFGYLFGVPAAFVSALMLVVGSSLADAEPGPVFAGAVGLICGIAFAMLFHRAVDAGGLGVPAYFVLKVLTCLVPTLICWWLVCRRNAPTNENG
jgi:hypothetical protein